MNIEDEVKKLLVIQEQLESQEIIIEDYYKNIIRLPLENAVTIQDFKDIKKLFRKMPDIIGKDFMLRNINVKIEDINSNQIRKDSTKLKYGLLS